jgi:hypothetical protein
MIRFGSSLMHAHLAYMSGRACVFQEYAWAHFRWSKAKANWWREGQTPLNVIVSGPVAGRPFESDDLASRAISQDWFDVVCPKDERRYIDIKARSAKPCGCTAGIRIRERNPHPLADGAPRCTGAVARDCRTVRGGDAFPQILDHLIWKSPRILSLRDSASQSPISRLLDASPIVRSTVARNYLFIPCGPRPAQLAPRVVFQRMHAVHARRGDDYEAHCHGHGMNRGNKGFYGWNLFPRPPDRFVPEPEADAPGKDLCFLARDWRNQAGVVRKVAEVRREYLVHATQSNATLDVVYILSNERGAWIHGLKKMLQKTLLPARILCSMRNRRMCQWRWIWRLRGA